MATPDAIYKQTAWQQPYTPGAAAQGGDIVLLTDGRAAVVKDDLAASEKGAVYTSGLFKVTCPTGTAFTAGDRIYWDADGLTALAAVGATGDFYLGTCVTTKTTELFVWVDLNAKHLLGPGLADYEEIILASGALATYGVSKINSAAGAITGTLADGTTAGQIKVIVMTEATASSTVSLAHHVTSDPEVATFDAVDEIGTWIWNGTEWADFMTCTCTYV